MSERDSTRSELDALRAELSPVPSAGSSNGGSAEGRFAEGRIDWGEVEQVLRDVQANVTDAARDASDVISRNPITAVASALLLGMVIGRLLGGRR